MGKYSCTWHVGIDFQNVFYSVLFPWPEILFYLKLDVNIKESSMSNVLFDFHFSQNFLLLIGYQQVQFYFQ